MLRFHLRRLHSLRFQCWCSDLVAETCRSPACPLPEGAFRELGWSRRIQSHVLGGKWEKAAGHLFNRRISWVHRAPSLLLPSSLGMSMSDWLTFATLFSSRACELCSSSPAGSQSNTVLTLPGLQDRVQEGGFGESSHTPSPSTVSFFFPHLHPTWRIWEVSRRRDVHTICLLTFTLGNLSRHCPQQHLISETLKSHSIQMQIKSFLTITVE